MAKRPTDNMGSYDLYLRALPLARTFTRADKLQALDLLSRAIELDPDFARGLCFAALCHAHISSDGSPDENEIHARLGLQLAQRALQLAGEDAEVLSWAADALANLGKDLGTATGLIDRALALNPGCSLAWFESGWLRVMAGGAELGVEHLETSMRLDPLSPYRANQLSWLGVARFEQRRFREAVAFLEQSTQLLPFYPINPPMLAACYGHLGQTTAAREALARHRTLSPEPIDELAKFMLRNADHRKLFLEGIVLAQGKSPSGSPTAG